MNCADCKGEIKRAKQAIYCKLHKVPICKGCWKRHANRHLLNCEFGFNPREPAVRDGGC